MANAKCRSCHFLLAGDKSPTGQKWCGWKGGDPDPGDPNRCNPLLTMKVPEELAIAPTGRVIFKRDLLDENATFYDTIGRPELA